MSLLEAYIITFIASFCSLVIEMVAGRILAPFVGVSLYTWTSIIGVILTGISIGAYIGGQARGPLPAQEHAWPAASAFGHRSPVIIPLTNMVAAYRFPFSLMWRIFTVTAIIFFIPGCILGTISPVVVRLTLQSLNKAGNVIGKIYAFSTLGAIIGTFATGFLLISWMGTRNIIFTMGVILILDRPLFRPPLHAKSPVHRDRRPLRRLSGAPLHLGVQDARLISARLFLQGERLLHDQGDKDERQGRCTSPVEALILDHLIHSYVNLAIPCTSSTSTRGYTARSSNGCTSRKATSAPCP